MESKLGIAAYVTCLVVVIVSLDVLVFRHHLLARLLANVGIVLLFSAFYLALVKRS